MAKVTNIRHARETKRKQASATANPSGFTPCSQDMTICGDCEDNRSKNKCPRLKEWLAKQKK